MDKILYVKKKNVFGNELVYPVCKDAILFTKLLKQESLTSDDMARIKSLVYTYKHIEVKIWIKKNYLKNYLLIILVSII